MATVIDHVLLELGLDTKKFDDNIKKSAEVWLKARQQAEDAQRHTEEPVNAMGKAFSSLTTKVLAFAASLVTIQKLAQLGAELVKGNIDLRNLSQTTQDSVETLSKWGNVAERSGSSFNSMMQAISGMDRELKQIAITGGGGNLTTLVNSLNQMGADIKIGPATKATDLWMKIISEMDRLGMDTRRKTAFLEQLGYADPSVIAMLTRGSENMKRMLKEQDDIYVVTGKNVEESDRLWRAWYELEQRAKSLGQVVMHDLFEPIKNALIGANIGVDAVKGRVTAPEKKDAFGGPNSGRSGQGAMIQPFLFPFGSGLGGEGRKDSATPPRNYQYVAPPGSGDDGDGDKLPNNAMPNAFQRSSVTPTRTYSGAASFYSGLPSEGGAMTSTGERVRPDTYSGALQTDLAKQYGGLRKNGVWADVVDDATGKRVRVYLNDTGPLRPGRMVDLSPKAFQEFAPLSKGVVPNLRMEMLPPAPPGSPYKGGPVGGGNAFNNGAPPIPWLSNPRLLRSPRFNQTLNPAQNYATSEMTVHSLIVNSANKPITDDAYGLATEAIPALERGGYMSQMTEGPF
jgi:rare lipoprotein A